MKPAQNEREDSVPDIFAVSGKIVGKWLEMKVPVLFDAIEGRDKDNADRENDTIADASSCRRHDRLHGCGAASIGRHDFSRGNNGREDPAAKDTPKQHVHDHRGMFPRQRYLQLVARRSGEVQAASGAAEAVRHRRVRVSSGSDSTQPLPAARLVLPDVRDDSCDRRDAADQRAGPDDEVGEALQIRAMVRVRGGEHADQPDHHGCRQQFP